MVDWRLLLVLNVEGWRLSAEERLATVVAAVAAPGQKDMDGEGYCRGEDDLWDIGGEQRCGWERKVGGEGVGCLVEVGEDCALTSSITGGDIRIGGEDGMYDVGRRLFGEHGGELETRLCWVSRVLTLRDASVLKRSNGCDGIVLGVNCSGILVTVPPPSGVSLLGSDKKASAGSNSTIGSGSFLLVMIRSLGLSRSCLSGALDSLAC